MHDAYQRAVALLARREHGAAELGIKLAKKGHLLEDIQAALETCRRLGLQDDRRFAEQKMFTRRAQGYGPERIRLELKQLEISRDIVDAVLMDETIDWCAVAQSVLLKKYGRGMKDALMRQKQKQFLYYRGFSAHTITQVLSMQMDTTENDL